MDGPHGPKFYTKIRDENPLLARFYYMRHLRRLDDARLVKEQNKAEKVTAADELACRNWINDTSDTGMTKEIRGTILEMRVFEAHALGITVKATVTAVTVNAQGHVLLAVAPVDPTATMSLMRWDDAAGAYVTDVIPVARFGSPVVLRGFNPWGTVQFRAYYTIRGDALDYDVNPHANWETIMFLWDPMLVFAAKMKLQRKRDRPELPGDLHDIISAYTGRRHDKGGSA